jgi:hypothetical protein
LIDAYTPQYFEQDIQSNDFILPIKYLAAHNDLASSKQALNLLTSSPSSMGDVLYR